MFRKRKKMQAWTINKLTSLWTDFTLEGNTAKFRGEGRDLIKREHPPVVIKGQKYI